MRVLVLSLQQSFGGSCRSLSLRHSDGDLAAAPPDPLKKMPARRSDRHLLFSGGLALKGKPWIWDDDLGWRAYDVMCDWRRSLHASDRRQKN